MAKYYSEKRAKDIFGNDFGDKYPSISRTGSLRGMKSKFGWDLNKVIKSGGYYYHLQDHPYFKR